MALARSAHGNNSKALVAHSAMRKAALTIRYRRSAIAFLLLGRTADLPHTSKKQGGTTCGAKPAKTDLSAHYGGKYASSCALHVTVNMYGANYTTGQTGLQ